MIGIYTYRYIHIFKKLQLNIMRIYYFGCDYSNFVLNLFLSQFDFPLCLTSVYLILS